ncbi:hypothetical protein J6590_024887 [Homalodisca vitripennis]|nr:hypothetical protein J6590_024887 [Homalodisca vitripennis]
MNWLNGKSEPNRIRSRLSTLLNGPRVAHYGFFCQGGPRSAVAVDSGRSATEPSVPIKQNGAARLVVDSSDHPIGESEHRTILRHQRVYLVAGLAACLTDYIACTRVIPRTEHKFHATLSSYRSFYYTRVFNVPQESFPKRGTNIRVISLQGIATVTYLLPLLAIRNFAFLTKVSKLPVLPLTKGDRSSNALGLDVLFPVLLFNSSLLLCAQFLRHANCMWEVKQDYEECARDYQQKIQDLSSLMSNDSSDGDTEHHVRRLCW